MTAAIITTVFAASALARGAPAAQVYTIVPEQSRAIIKVGKAGALSFMAGHTHEVEGPIRGTLTVDGAHPEAAVVAIDINAAQLRVTGRGEPADDVPTVQDKMVSASVLDVARYPTITFKSTTVAVGTRGGTAVDLTVSGDLTLHGTTKSITVLVHAELTPNRITAQGTFSVKQSDYGITPVSIGGVVSVRDVLDIRFTIVAGE